MSVNPASQPDGTTLRVTRVVYPLTYVTRIEYCSYINAVSFSPYPRLLLVSSLCTSAYNCPHLYTRYTLIKSYNRQFSISLGCVFLSLISFELHSTFVLFFCSLCSFVSSHPKRSPSCFSRHNCSQVALRTTSGFCLVYCSLRLSLI